MRSQHRPVADDCGAFGRVQEDIPDSEGCHPVAHHSSPDKDHVPCRSLLCVCRDRVCQRRDQHGPLVAGAICIFGCAHGVFAIGYAASGIILRNQFWKAMLPLMAVQFATMGFLNYRFPDRPPQAQLNR